MTDIVIIGGGIAGISAAARLSHLGKVVVLETEDALGYHATGRSAAMFLEHYGNAAIKALNSASASYHRSANGGVLTPRGMMLLAKADERDAFTTESRELGTDEISFAEARALVPILNPDHVAFASLNTEGSDLDTDLLLQNFAREARANGAEILTGAKVAAINKTPTGWHIVTPKGDFTAPVLVNAAGAWVDEVAKLASVAPLGFQPYRRSMARIPAPGGHDVSAWPMMDGINEAWYAKPDAGKLLVSPAEEHATDPHDAWADDMVLAEGLARYEEMMTEPVTRLETSWAGLRTFAPDRTLVVGFDRTEKGFFWLGGQGGYGFQTAPAVSDLCAQLIGGQETTLDRQTIAKLDPARFG